MRSTSRTTTIDTTPEVIWAALAEFDAIATWVPLIQHSCALPPSRTGPGAARRIQLPRQTLVERVTVWEPSQRLAYTIDGLPPLVGTPETTWTLTARGDATAVEITTAIRTGINPLRALAASAALKRLGLAADMMLAGLSTHVAPPESDQP